MTPSQLHGVGVGILASQRLAKGSNASSPAGPIRFRPSRRRRRALPGLSAATTVSAAARALAPLSPIRHSRRSSVVRPLGPEEAASWEERAAAPSSPRELRLSPRLAREGTTAASRPRSVLASLEETRQSEGDSEFWKSSIRFWPAWDGDSQID
jgi:hypothetical protein